MAEISHLPLEHRLFTVRELYAELFILLNQSVNGPADRQGGGTLDRTIETLMHTIEGEMTQLRRETDAARSSGSLGETLGQAIMNFNNQLREALTLMSQCVERRVAQLRVAREELKSKLKGVQAKKRGARGYRVAYTSTKMLESQI